MLNTTKITIRQIDRQMQYNYIKGIKGIMNLEIWVTAILGVGRMKLKNHMAKHRLLSSTY